MNPILLRFNQRLFCLSSFEESNRSHHCVRLLCISIYTWGCRGSPLGKFSRRSGCRLL